MRILWEQKHTFLPVTNRDGPPHRGAEVRSPLRYSSEVPCGAKNLGKKNRFSSDVIFLGGVALKAVDVLAKIGQNE